MKNRTGFNRFARMACAAMLCISLASVACGGFDLETVAVGNAGNTGDTEVMIWSEPASGYGAVDYNYNIGKYEVTAGQYTDFLNTKATSTDPHGLYNPQMWSDDYGGCKIQRIGSSGNYTYSVSPTYANRPVNYVSFWDAARLANWMHNGQGLGDTETGAYTLTADGIANNTTTRNGGWKWAVTSEDEWYKAAFYDPAKPGGAGYWDYPTKADAPNAPSNVLEPSDPGNNATFYADGYTDSLHYTTEVGAHENSASPYGTFDQAGNVSEWNESIMLGNGRGFRGGYYGDTVGGLYEWLQAEGRNCNAAEAENSNTGFRLSQVFIPMVNGTPMSVPTGGSFNAWSAGPEHENNEVEVNFNGIDGELDFAAETTEVTGEQLAKLDAIMDSLVASGGTWVNWSFTLSRDLVDGESTEILFNLGRTDLREEDIRLWHFDGANYTPITSALDFSHMDLGVFSAMGLIDFSDYTVTIVPEPATMTLLVLGGVAMIRRRR